MGWGVTPPDPLEVYAVPDIVSQKYYHLNTCLH